LRDDPVTRFVTVLVVNLLETIQVHQNQSIVHAGRPALLLAGPTEHLIEVSTVIDPRQWIRLRHLFEPGRKEPVLDQRRDLILKSSNFCQAPSVNGSEELIINNPVSWVR